MQRRDIVLRPLPVAPQTCCGEGTAHCTLSAAITATLAVNEWFELKGPRAAPPRPLRLLPRVLGSIVSTLPKAGAHRRHLGAHQGKATSRPSRPSGLAYASSPPRARSSRPGVVPGRQRLCPMPQCHRRRSFGPQTSATGGGGGTGTTPDAPLRVGRRYPAAASDAPPSRIWDSGRKRGEGACSGGSWRIMCVLEDVERSL